MAWAGIIGESFDRASFAAYVAGLSFAAWRPRFAVLHNTAAPRLDQWHSAPGKARMRNLEHYYRDQKGWSAGPHLFVADDLIWVFTPLTRRGVHSPSWNSVSWGIEMVGDFDTEEFASGPGAQVRDNTVSAIATLYEALGIEARSLRLHKEDPGTTHACPGRKVVKEDMIARIEAAIMDDNPGDHALPEAVPGA